MNRIVINTAAPDACIPCGGEGKVRLDIADFGIVGVFTCPSCGDDADTRALLGPLMDYLTRPKTVPPSVIA